MLNQYPRPQLKRKSWTNLNGTWDFTFDEKCMGKKEKWFNKFPSGTTIQVPYTYETKMSGIGDTSQHSVVWYHRSFDLAGAEAGRTLLHFEACDYLTEVWVNGSYAGSHEGGNAAFTLDITEQVREGENGIVVRAVDSMSCTQPRGKQRWKHESYGCWYVQTTGIWKTVWIEQVSGCYLKEVKITPDIDKGEVEFLANIGGYAPEADIELLCDVSFLGKRIAAVKTQVEGEYIRVKLNLLVENKDFELRLWSPQQPQLYDVEFVLSQENRELDRVGSYFGMRKVSIENGKVLLNNISVYQRLILDQGYWPESGLTAPSDEALEKDIDLILAAGYNGLREHQKIADRRFLSLCDKKGVLVWSEMPAQYSFNDGAVQRFTHEWMEIVKQNYNSPAVITWTPFNESWGVEQILTNRLQQQFTEAVYHLTKAFDPMRPVIVNDGWEHTVSDIITLHDYEDNGAQLKARYEDKNRILSNEIPHNKKKYAMASGYSYKGQPVIISEYGGIAFAGEMGWGYGDRAGTGEEFLKRFDDMTSAIKELDYVVGYCYTQVTDVEQEVNGLYGGDRKPKVDIERVRGINLK